MEAVNGGVSVRDRAAVYNLIVQPPRRIEPAEALLKTATGYWDVSNYTSGAQVVPNRGTGGSTLDAQLGSTSSVDSNDPSYLPFSASTGSYLHFPGVNGNYATVPDAANLRLTGDLEIVLRARVDDWTTGTVQSFVTRRPNTYQLRTGAGTLEWVFWQSGSPRIINSAAVPMADGAWYWLKMTFDADDGAAGCSTAFYYAADSAAEPSSWTQIGSAVVSAGVATIDAAVGVSLAVGGWLGGEGLTGGVRRAIVRDGIGGTTVLDVDTSVLTSGAATSFAATTGQTVTINRSSTGRKAVAVVRPVMLFGTDDYLTVADNDLLDFGASEPFTIIVLGRTWTTASVGPYVSKASAYASGAGYHVTRQGGAPAYASVSDGTATPIVSAGSTTNGAASFIAVARDPVADQVQGSLNGSAYATASDTTTGALSNSSPLRIGAVGAVYLDFEWQFAAVFRRALTASEISMLATYAAARMP